MRGAGRIRYERWELQPRPISMDWPLSIKCGISLKHLRALKTRVIDHCRVEPDMYRAQTHPFGHGAGEQV